MAKRKFSSRESKIVLGNIIGGINKRRSKNATKLGAAQKREIGGMKRLSKAQAALKKAKKGSKGYAKAQRDVKLAKRIINRAQAEQKGRSVAARSDSAYKSGTKDASRKKGKKEKKSSSKGKKTKSTSKRRRARTTKPKKGGKKRR